MNINSTDAISRADGYQSLPLDVSRCAPSLGCPQMATCARALDWYGDALFLAPVIDASIALAGGTPGGCSLFLDARGRGLMEAAWVS